MKSRSGFVSNSSSSSYIIMLSDEVFEDVLTQTFTEEIHRRMIRAIVKSSVVMGVPCKTLSYMSGNENSWDEIPKTVHDKCGDELSAYCDANDQDEMDEFMETLYQYQCSVKKQEKGFVHCEQC